jgi:hypothetical protein
MPEHTIKAKYGIDTKDAKDALDDIKKHAERHGRDMGGGGIGKLFALEPLGVRRGAHALEGLAEGFTNVAGEGRDALAAVTQFGRALSVGFGAGLAIGGAGVLANRFVEINTEATNLEQTIAGLSHRGATSGRFEGMDHMRDVLTESAKQADALRGKLAGFGGETIGGKAVGSFSATMEAVFRGMTPGGLREELGRQIKELNETASGQVTKMAEKSNQLAKIEETRFRIGEKEAVALAEQVKHDEALGTLSELTNKTKKQNLALTDEENRRNAEAVKQNDIAAAAIDREYNAKQKSLTVSEKMANRQREISNLQTMGLTRQEMSVRAAREGVDIAAERQSLAEIELETAKKQVEAAQEQGTEAKRAAAERLSRAQAGVIGARAGVTNAAAAAASVEEGRLLEKGREEEMSPQEKSAQYNQRIKQMEGLRHAFAREGKNTDLIDAPKYGEAEYDPLARYRSARTQEMQQQEQARLLQEKAQRQAQEQSQAESEKKDVEQRGLVSRYAAGHDMTNVSPEAAAQVQRNIEANEAHQRAMREAQSGTPAPSGEYRTEKGGEWHNIEQENAVGVPDYEAMNRPFIPNNAKAIESRTDELIKTKHLQPSQAAAQAQAEADAGKPMTKADLESVMQQYWGKGGE